MADGSNLKAKVGMDTGDFEKGAKKVTKAAQSMGKDIGTSLSGVGRELGVNLGLLGDLSQRIGDATTLFQGMASAGGNAASGLTKAMVGLGGAIAGLGITGAVLAFQELNREVSNFETRMQGVNIAAGAKAYRDTYRQYLDDVTGAGERTANWWEGFKNNFARDWADITHPFASRNDRNTAQITAEYSSRLASERVDLNRELDAQLVSQAQYQRDINAQLLIARDRSKDKAERDAAQAKAVELINEKYDEQADLSARILRNQEEQDRLTNNTDAESRETYQTQANLLNIESQRQQELSSMVRLENQITGAKTSQVKPAQETQKATELTLEAATRLVEQERALKAIQDQNKAMMAAARFRMDGSLPDISAPQGSAQALTVPAIIKPVVDTEAAQAAIVELSGVIESGVVGMSDAIGTLIGDLINGEDAWGNFAQAGVSVVADMLATVGKAFITEGVGVMAAKAALTTGNGAAAIAAGAAMVALAATMKTAMSNAASNWGGSSGSVASSSYASGSASGVTAFGREMNIKVSGTLTANGSKLVAVLNNENDRRNYTT